MTLSSFAKRIPLLFITVGCWSCSSAPIHGTLVSTEKNIWVDDPSSTGLSYCVSNSDGKTADPVCYTARRDLGGASPQTSPASSEKHEKAEKSEKVSESK